MYKKVTQKAIFFLFLILKYLNTSVAAQIISLPAAEEELAGIYTRLFSQLNNSSDSLEYYSAAFSNKIQETILQNPPTLKYPFTALKDSNYCFIATSADGLFRKYTWNTWLGGTMHSFEEIDQFNSNGVVYANAVKLNEYESGSFCSKIFTINIGEKPYYLSIENGIYSTRDASQSIKVYSIVDNQLIDTVKLFNNKKELLNRIDVYFDFFSVVDRPERPLELITYDETQKILYIPVVDEKGAVTDQNMLYQLQGEYFELTGIEKGKR